MITRYIGVSERGLVVTDADGTESASDAWLIADNVGTFQVVARFEPEWAGLEVTAAFELSRQGSKPEVRYNDETDGKPVVPEDTLTLTFEVPAEIMQLGTGYLRLAFYATDDSGTYITRRQKQPFKVKAHGAIEGSVSGKPTKDIIQQAIDATKDVQKAVEAANNAVDSANEAVKKVSVYEEAEKSRSDAEAYRVAAETDRAESEALRKSAEASRVIAESDRSSAESARASAFVDAQESRSEAYTAAESARDSNYAAAENARNEEFSHLKEDASGAISGAEKVNATVSGTKLTVTDRNGSSTTVDTKGENGVPATVKVGTVTTGEAGSKVIINNRGTDSAVVLDFTIPKGDKGDAQVQTDWNATSGMGVLLNKPSLASVATSGSYNDLSDKPTIPDNGEFESLKTKCSSNSKNVSTLQEEIDVLTKAVAANNSENQLRETLDGESVTTEDAFPSPLYALTVDGAYEQTTYSGKNLLDVSKAIIGYTLNSSGITEVNNQCLYIDQHIDMQSDSNLAVKVFEYPSSISTIVMRVCWYSDDGTFIRRDESYDFSTGHAFTAPDNTGYAMFTAYLGVNVESSVVSALKIQAEKSSTATSYEPYCGGVPSPNPDYPQEIAVVEGTDELSGCVSVDVVGKNLLDTSSVKGSTVYGVTWTRDSDGTFTATGTATADSCGLSVGAVDVAVEVGSSYTVTTSSSDDIFMRIGKGKSHSFVVSNVKEYTFTADDSIYSVALYVKKGTTVSNAKARLQLEHGSTATSYEPYTKTQHLIDLATACPDHPYLAALPDGTKDELYYDADGRLTLVANVGKRVFNSASGEAWSFSSTTKWLYCALGNTDYQNLKGIYSGKFCCNVGTATDWLSTDVGKGCASLGSPSVTAYALSQYDFPDEETLNKYLAEHDVVFMFAKLNPTTYDLGTIDQIEVPSDKSTLSVDAEVVPTIHATYVQDVNAVIDSIRSAIVASQS